MQKATATYVAPFGDNKVVEMDGLTFFDGKSVEFNSYDHPHLIEKLKGNQHFDVEVGKDDEQPKPKAKRGRPSNADVAAAKAEADEAEKTAIIAKEKAFALKKASEEAAKDAAKPETKGPVLPVSQPPANPPAALVLTPAVT